MGEGEYLEDQCRRAKAGMRLAIRELRHDAIQSVDPRCWARAHPWGTVAAAVVAGFAATRVIDREPKQVEAPSPQAGPVDHPRGRVARFVSLVARIYAVAQPLFRAVMIAQMNRAPSIQQPASAA
ncbi:MAG: hypothetical protein ABSB74_04965 [Tepidisphaeraceae bacterium]